MVRVCGDGVVRGGGEGVCVREGEYDRVRGCSEGGGGVVRARRVLRGWEGKKV